MNNFEPVKQCALISIVMATYNGARYIREQLDSILAQTYPNFEIVVIDDNSTDRTFEILEEYAKNQKVRIFRNPENLGVTVNFEKAMRLADGELIALSDQDDIWMHDKLAALVGHLGNCTLTYANSTLIEADGTPTGKTLQQQLKIRPIEGKQDRAFYFSNCIPGHAMLFKKTLLDYALPLPKHSMYDQWLAFVSARLNGIAYLNRPLVQYRQHPQSVVNAPRQLKKGQRLSRHLPGYRSKKLERRATAAHNRANSLRDFANSDLTRNEDRHILLRIANEYERFNETFINLRLLRLLCTNRHDFFKIPRRPRLLSCFRETMGARYLRLLPS